MKYLISWKTLLCLIMLPVAACNSKAKKTGNPISPNNEKDIGTLKESTYYGDSIFNKTSPIKGKRYFYRLDVPAGATYEYSIYTSNTARVKAPQQDVTTTTDLNFTVQYQISKNEEGRQVFGIVYKKLGLNIQTTGKEDQRYNSENTESIERWDKLLVKLKGVRFNIIMNDSGKVLAVEGVSEIESDVLADMQSDPIEVREVIKKFIAQISGAEFIENNLGKALGLSSIVGLEVGRQWTERAETTETLNLDATVDNRITKVSEDEVVVSTEGNIQTDKSNSIKMFDSNFNTELKGSQKGLTRIDPLTGLPISIESTMEVKGILFSVGKALPIEIIIKKRIKGKRI